MVDIEQAIEEIYPQKAGAALRAAQVLRRVAEDVKGKQEHLFRAQAQVIYA